MCAPHVGRDILLVLPEIIVNAIIAVVIKELVNYFKHHKK